VNAIILPCGHIAYCSDRLKQWFQRSNICPTCRKEIEAVHKIFLS